MSAPLAKPNGQYDLAKNGIADIAWSVAAYHPKRFKLLTGAELPFTAPNAEVSSVAAWTWYEKNGFVEKETADTKLLTVFAHAPHAYHSSKPLATLADFKDLKVRAGGAGVEILKTLGAVPVFINAPGTNEALTRGTIDATQFPWESVKGFRLAKVTSHHLDVPGGTYAGLFYLTMSPKTWDSLSDSQKAAVTKVSGSWGARFIGQKWDAADQGGINAIKEAGGTINVLSDAETAQLKSGVSFLRYNWIKAANEMGLDGSALLDDLAGIVAKETM
jgi:TRAP-type C4-dicarboxylate transport system substrate-binding protein